VIIISYQYLGLRLDLCDFAAFSSCDVHKRAWGPVRLENIGKYRVTRIHSLLCFLNDSEDLAVYDIFAGQRSIENAFRLKLENQF
jgi:hypothetical protein